MKELGAEHAGARRDLVYRLTGPGLVLPLAPWTTRTPGTELGLRPSARPCD